MEGTTVYFIAIPVYYLCTIPVYWHIQLLMEKEKQVLRNAQAFCSAYTNYYCIADFSKQTFTRILLSRNA